MTAKLGRVSTRFGYGKESRSFLLTDSVKIPDWKNEKHEIFYYLNLIAEVENKYFGTKTVLESEPRFELKVSQERKTEARQILTENGVDTSKKIVAFVAGSTNSRAKRWKAESFAALNDKFQNELNINIILIGAKNELPVSQEVYEKIYDEADNFDRKNESGGSDGNFEHLRSVDFKRYRSGTYFGSFGNKNTRHFRSDKPANDAAFAF